MASPIQIVLNPGNYEAARETAGGGPKKDFFANRDDDFREHKTKLVAELNAIAKALRAQPQSDIGFVKVILRREAWAKSHRPLKALFKPERTPLVGGGDLGVMVVEARPPAIARIMEEVQRAEALGKEIPYPSARRSEAGAIERIEMYGPTDRRAFSLDDAVAWLSRPMTGSGYQVELFEAPPPRSEWDAYDVSHQRLFQSFVDGLSAIGKGLTVQRLASRARSQPLLSMRLDRSGQPAVLHLTPASQTERRREVAPFDTTAERHARLLAFLDRHPLVRHVSLPGMIVRSAAISGQTSPSQVDIPARDMRRTYPRIGIIDGGLGAALSDWVIERWDILADEDVDFAHGTFIGGLSVIGGSLNGSATCPEPDGAELADIGVFPNDQSAGTFASYYPEGLPQLSTGRPAATIRPTWRIATRPGCGRCWTRS